MSLFDHGDLDEFLLFVRNFQMTLSDMGTIETVAKVWFLSTIFRGGALRLFNLMSAHVKINYTILDVDYLLKGLAWHSLPVYSLSKKKRVMRRCMKNHSA